MGKYFGTDGFRGEANKNLDYEHAIKIGRFLGWYYGAKQGKKAKVVIGKDTRRSSYMFEYALCTGLMASGADAYIMHVTTTPSVSYIARVDDFDCGIMISASHNPYYDNGIKLLNSNGEKMDEETILMVEDYIDGKIEVPLAERDAIGRTVDYVAGRNRYIGYLISMSKYSFKDKKVGLDCANGASWSIARGVFDALGAKTYVINDEPDGYNINTDCGSTHIEHLQKFVVEKGLDIGFAYDGDADRCLAVDEKGNIVTGDHILYIYGKYMKERGKLINNKVVTTVMSNFGLYKALDKIGIEYEKTKVGDKYVYENMVETGNRIGGEQSGHIIFSKYATTGDGILTSLKLMEVMLAKEKPMSELAAHVVFYPLVLKNVRVKSKPEAQNDPDVQKAVASVAEALGD
ncbi:MAG: phosphoglucosamine mutase, partial [Clostridiales bacterium]|nr:phosphoglucosamine mutase [Clostridiales bacterium]